MKNTLFIKWFKDLEPELFREIERLKNKQSLFIFSTIAIVGIAFLVQFFVPIGLKISILVIAIWLLLLLATLSIFPAFIIALKVFSKSNIQKRVAIFITICCIFFVSATYMVYKLIPFFSGGLELFYEG
jgi:cation transport ATPase